jgi:rod shape-determining protein MreD
MNQLSIAVILVFNIILQTTLLQHFRIFGIIPNTTLILVVILAILYGRKKGAVIGLIAGLLQDILIGRLLGASALVYMLVGLIIGSFENKIFKDHTITPIFFAVLGTLGYHLMYYFIMYIVNENIDIPLLFTKIIVIEAMYNSVIAGFAYGWIYNFLYHSKTKIKTR